MAPGSIGPYRILATLGRGGMGVVYRARHGATGLEVALKTLAAPAERQLASLRREIHALARLRHPGVVRVLDEGVVDGVPWYAMELLTGERLSTLAARLTGRSVAPRLPSQETLGSVPAAGEAPTEPAPPSRGGATVPLPAARPPVYAIPDGASRPPVAGGALQAILTIAHRLCAPLAYLHGEGIVHRDLKPDNILVGDAGMPVIVDFGLTSRFTSRQGREVLDAGAEAMGTAWYVAPEQARGELVDARADLYALGCILHELLTGRPPFVGESTAAILWQHFEQAPMPISRLVDGAPAELEELLLRLLAKNPWNRVGHAEDVAEVLCRAGARPSPVPLPPGRPHLYRPAFTGRQDVVHALRGMLPDDRPGHAPLILVAGPSGSGKTRLLMELGADAARRGLRVVAGEGGAGGDARPAPLGAFRPVLAALRDRGREVGPGAAALLRARGGALAPFVHALDPPAEAPAPPLPPALACREIHAALAEGLAALSLERPLLVLLDDVHWADELTRGFLEHWAREPAASGAVTIVASYRSEGRPRWLGELEPVVALQRLDRLPDPAVSRMVADMLAVHPPPQRLVESVVRHAEGNPFVVAEYLHAAVSTGMLARLGGTWTFDGDAAHLPLPGAVRDLCQRRLDLLGPDARRLAEAFAVAGREAEEALILEVTAGDVADGLAALSEILTSHVLEPSAPGTCRFAHETLREALLERLPPDRASRWHGTLAARLEASGASRPEDLAALSEHLRQAGHGARAAAAARRAADAYAARHALGEAERLYEAAISMPGAAEDAVVAARLALAHGVLEIQGRTDEALAVRRQALADARALRAPALEAEALRGLSVLHRIRGDLDRARELLEDALAVDVGRGARGGQALDLRSLAGILGDRGQWEEARRLYERAMEIHRETGDRRGEGLVKGDLGLVMQYQARTEEARDLYEASLAIHRELGDRRFEGTVLLNLATLDHVTGRLSAAGVRYEDARRILAEVGDRRNEAAALANLADIEAETGRPAEACRLYEAAIAGFAAVGEARNRAIALTNHSHVLRAVGRSRDAAARAREAHAIQESLGDPRGIAAALTALGAAELASERVADASAAALAAHEALRASGSVLMEGETLPCLAHLLQAAGEGELAMRLLAEAPAELARVGDALTAAKCACERGLAAIREGRPADGALAEAAALASPLGLPAASRIGVRIAALRQAATAGSGSGSLS